MQQAASTKKFKEARRNQEFLDKLEALKPLLPTSQELMATLSKTRSEMEEAINKKEFERAEQLHEVVEDLEKKVTLEQINVVQPVAAPTPLRATVSKVARTPFKLKVDAPSVATGPSIPGSVRSKFSNKVANFKISLIFKTYK